MIQYLVNKHKIKYGWAMESKPLTIQPISDDQDLAKALAGVSDDFKIEDSAQAAIGENTTTPEPQEEVLMSTPEEQAEELSTIQPNESETQVPVESNKDEPASTIADTLPSVLNMPEVKTVSNPAPVEFTTSENSDLEDIKKDALLELRPLIDKLDLSPEEKFDICLLLLRSTDDKTLIAPAHDAAREISDESRRAQALLDIVKEIDYLSGPTQPTV